MRILGNFRGGILVLMIWTKAYDTGFDDIGKSDYHYSTLLIILIRACDTSFDDNDKSDYAQKPCECTVF